MSAEHDPANAVEDGQTERPWERLEAAIASDDADAVRDELDAVREADRPLALARLADACRTRLVELLPPDTGAEVVSKLPGTMAVDLVKRLEPPTAAAVVGRMRSDAQADLLGDLDWERARAILAEMHPDDARRNLAFTRYPDDVAGGLMIREHLTYPETFTVGQVFEDMRRYAERYRDYPVQYAYVVRDGRLLGVLRLRDLLFAAPERSIRDVMRPDPVALSDRDDLGQLRAFFDRHPFFGAPVVDAEHRLLGIVTRSAVEAARADRSDADYLKTQGIVGGEELRTMPIMVRSRRRLAWLSINVGLNLIAASVIAFYQDTIAAVIALAVFLPIISDMSGCSGNQAVAVSMRELTLGLVRPGEVLRVWSKEIAVGLLNGVALGLLIALAAWAWKGNPVLGAVVGIAMAVNTLVAVSIGGTVPLVLRKLGMDPALASGPILTTVTDMSGFFLLLSSATFAMPHLLGS